MEADWEVEIGPGLPVIDAHWPGFVNLRQTPELAHFLPEAASLPALGSALIQLNNLQSPIWTAKCDLWPLEPGSFDPYEMESDPETGTHGCAVYIDLLPSEDRHWPDPATAISFCKQLCPQLHTVLLNNSRADLVVRSAVFDSQSDALGITAYIAACGPTSEHAKQVLETALRAFAHAISPNSTVE